MLLEIRHTTELAYDARIAESVMELRVTPRSDGQQTLRGLGLAVAPSASLQEHVDWLGNRVHSFSIIEPHDRIVIVAHSAVETRAPRALPERALARVPDAPDHRALDWVTLQGPVDPSPALDELARRLGLVEGARLGALLERVQTGVREVLRYQKGVTDSLTPASRALELGAGVCQDFAHVAIALLRRSGVPARYVSGYLYRAGAPEVETHAWVEAQVPQAGWWAFDPTHGEPCGERHVAVAVGRSYADVPPNRGVFKGTAEERIRATVRIDAVEEVPRTLQASLPAHLDVGTYSESARPHVEQIDYQQEQQQQ